jgi:hypothetical protein
MRLLEVLNTAGSCADTTAIAVLARTVSRANIVRCEGIEEFRHLYTPGRWVFIWRRPRALGRRRESV